jgi:hypothetical protein
MKRLGASIILSLVFGFLVVGVSGARGGKPGGSPDPCTGNPIDVLQSDYCGQSMRIEADDSTTVCAIECWLTSKNTRKCPTFVAWIGGIVVVDEAAPLGFYFDPSTVAVAEFTEEGSQTTLCAISENPASFAADPNRRWWVTANLSDLREL